MTSTWRRISTSIFHFSLSPCFSQLSRSPARAVSFIGLNIDSKIARLLRKEGIRKPTEIQMQAYDWLESGESAVLNSQTGSGKTLAYALPVIQNIIGLKKYTEKPSCPYCLVVVPSIELAYQVGDVFRKFLPAGNVCVASEDTPLRLKSTDVVVSTVAYISTYPLNVLNHAQTVIIDEADFLISKKVGKHGYKDPLFLLMNHLLDSNTFQATRRLQKRQFVFVGATMPDSLTPKSKKALPYIRKWVPDIKIVQAVDAHKFVSSVAMEFINVLEGNKTKQLVNSIRDILNTAQVFQVLVFVNKVETASLLYQQLTDAKHDTDDLRSNKFPRSLIRFQSDWRDCTFVLHKNIPFNERLSTLHLFSSLPKALLITTDVASRGLDFPNVDLVVQYDFSTNVADILHRAGRTARMGKHGKVVNFITEQDEKLASTMKDAIEKELSLDHLFSRKRGFGRKMKELETEVVQQ